jgi:hypothetical protein
MLLGNRPKVSSAVLTIPTISSFERDSVTSLFISINTTEPEMDGADVGTIDVGIFVGNADGVEVGEAVT